MRILLCLIFAFAATSEIHADVRQAKEIVSSFSNRVTQSLHPFEREYLLSDWQSHKSPVIEGLRSGTGNARRICAEVIESSTDASMAIELLAAYAVETEEDAKVAIIFAISSCHPSQRVLALAEDRFSNDASIPCRIAWCVTIIKSGGPKASLCWAFLLDGLKLDENGQPSDTERRAVSFRVRDTCVALKRLGIESRRALPLLATLAKEERLGVGTRAEVREAISVIESIVGGEPAAK